jgi:N-acetyl-anhydromuramyl-L-alanine amidase AmpD
MATKPTTTLKLINQIDDNGVADYLVNDRESTYDIKYVVIHTTTLSGDNTGGTTQGAIDHWQAGNGPVSAHYFVENSTIYQTVLDKDIAYHAGTATTTDYNFHGIGIEIVANASVPSSLSDLEYRAAADLTRWLCQTYDITMDHDLGYIIGHSEVPGVVGKTDPGPSFDWVYFMSLVTGGSEELPDLQIDNLTSTKQIVSANSTITVGAVVHNYGNVASGAFSTRIYISPHSTFDSSAIPLATFDGASYNPSGLAAGAVTTNLNKSVTFDDTLTSKLFSGTNYLIVIADYGNEFTDLNRDNNSFHIAITLDTTFPVEPQSTLPVGVGGIATLSTEFLLSYDNFSGPAGLTYTVVDAPTHGTLLLDGVATGTFTQADINADRVQYSQDGGAATGDGFTFTVADEAGNWIGPEPFTIAIVATADPVVFANDTATVLAGGKVAIWKDALSTVALGSDPAEMVYNIVTGPAYGVLVVNGTPVTSFTQADIDNGLFWYGQIGNAQIGSTAASDSFTFAVTDGNGLQTATQTFDINIIKGAGPSADLMGDALLVRGGVGPEWEFGGGLLLEDGHVAYLLRNTGAALQGALQVGEVIDGAAVYTHIGGIGPEWQLAGTGDFSGDGRADFLMRNTGDVLPGALYIGEVLNGAAVYTAIGGIGPEWELAGTGDFNGNGRADFLMLNHGDVIPGRLEVGEVVGGMLTFADIGTVGSEWGFAAIGDFVRNTTTNTTTDFLVRDTGSDAMMVGSVIDGATSFTSVYPGWNPAG